MCVCVGYVSLYLKKRPMYTQKRLIHLKKRPISSSWIRVCVCVCVGCISLYLKKRHICIVIPQKETYTPQRDLSPPHGCVCVCVCVCACQIYIFIPQKETYTPKRDPYVSRLWKRHVCGITAVHTRIHEKVRVL